MPYASSRDGVRIYYEQHGDGPVVLLVHGSGGHHASWWQQVPTLAERYCVLTLDLRGFGRSDAGVGPVDARAFPDDLLAVLDDTATDRAVLVGQSIGAAAALKAALRAPGRAAGVVLGHSLGGLADADLVALARADRAAAEKLPVPDRLLTAAFRRAHPDKAFLFQQMGTFNTAKMADLRNVGADGPTARQVVESGIPICFLTGEGDAVLSADTVREAAKRIPAAVLELVPDAPHAMYWEAPELFNAALDRFLRQVYPVETSVSA